MKNHEPDLCESITTLTKDDNSWLPSIINSNRRSREQALDIYIYCLKTGLFQNIIALFFSFKTRQRLLIQSIYRKVRNAFP